LAGRGVAEKRGKPVWNWRGPWEDLQEKKTVQGVILKERKERGSKMQEKEGGDKKW